ncbi:unnamed protein product [Brassica napus]|uniref:(rape) hypothetical protein n=1 Tax=Brassica napus TaxID=3708 RepID=A0A816KJZ9_BRANA|nr:unnamed protein product [Brassica napus]
MNLYDKIFAHICCWWFLKSVEVSISGRRVKFIGRARVSVLEVDLLDISVLGFIVDGSVLSALVFSDFLRGVSDEYAAFELILIVSCGSLTSGVSNRLEVEATSFGSRWVHVSGMLVGSSGQRLTLSRLAGRLEWTLRSCGTDPLWSFPVGVYLVCFF